MLRMYQSPFDATVVSLIEKEGARIAGKTNMDEFGMGSANTNSAFGTVINPAFDDDSHISGGSSGGSAAAVAASEADFALGTDTGGSVRLPASYCGVYGFKPTYGRISRWGVVAYAQSLDTVGIISRDLSTIRAVYGALDAPDAKDPTCLDTKIRLEATNNSLMQISRVVGVPEEFLLEEMSLEAKKVWEAALNTLAAAGYEIRPISIPTIKKLLLAYYTIATAEAASNLLRYDGIRYGHNDLDNNLSDQNPPKTAFDIICQNRTSSLGHEVQRRIILGNYTLSSDSGNHYLRATQLRQQLVEEFNAVFSAPSVLYDNQAYQPDGCCALVCPTAVSAAPTMAQYKTETSENIVSGYINDILTVPASLAGLPSISVPFGSTVGIQIMGQFADDATVLDVAEKLGDGGQ